MSPKVLLFADRVGRALAPLTDRTALALLPVAGKPVLEHTLEDLAMAGLKDVLAVVGPFADEIEGWVGGGERWGLTIEYTLAKGDEPPDAVVERLGARLPAEFLVVRGDVLRSPVLAAFLEKAAGRPDEPTLAASIGGRPCGVRLVRASAPRPVGLVHDPESGASWALAGPAVEMGGAALSLLDGLRGYHQANVDAISGGFPGLLVPGRELAVGLVAGRRSRVPLRSVYQGPVFVGSRCEVDAGAELLGPVVLSDDVVVDRRATLKNTVVLPGSYVGELVELENAIVSAGTLIRVDTGAVSSVVDRFLLADLNEAQIGSAVEGFAHRAWGGVLLVLSLPLWPAALLASLVVRPSRPLGTSVVRGNRVGFDATGVRRRLDVKVLTFAVPAPVLAHLPWLLRVMTGDLRVAGVTPLTPAEASALVEEWEKVPDEAPVGLFGPAQIGVPATAPAEEKRLADVFYARTRTPARDAYWLLRALGALLTPRAWRRAGDRIPG